MSLSICLYPPISLFDFSLFSFFGFGGLSASAALACIYNCLLINDRSSQLLYATQAVAKGKPEKIQA